MECPFCCRVYKIKTYFDRHVISCKLLQKSSKERCDDEETQQDTPNIRELYDIILEMNNTIRNLQFCEHILFSGF